MRQVRQLVSLARTPVLTLILTLSSHPHPGAHSPPTRNWARRKECNKCFSAHPDRRTSTPVINHADMKRDQAFGLDTGRSMGTAGGAKRTGEAGGFKEFDDAEDDRRKRRAVEERDLKAERKATKTKCEYCKRASCIC